MEENEITRQHPFTVISVNGTEEYPTLHDIQQNSAWSENPYGESYAVVPDDMVDDVMQCGCWCNIETENGVLTKITPVEPPVIPPTPHEPTDIEILQKENRLLKAQVSALAEQQEFLEDCLIEVGQVVYA